MQSLKTIGFYISLLIFGLGYTMIRAGLHNNNVPFVWLGIVGIVITMVIYISIIYRAKRKLKDAKNRKNLLINDIITNGIKTKINLENLLFGTLIDEPQSDAITVLDAIAEIENNVQLKQESNLTEYYIDVPYQDKTLRYLFKATQNITDLKIHFVLQKSTTLYTWGNKVYLDLKFLESED